MRKDMEDYYDLRELIECHALENGMRNIEGDRLRELLEVEMSISTKETEPRKPKEFVDADRELHLLIVDNCRNG
jgi:DNA-binding GntR family transcriptional regulator